MFDLASAPARRRLGSNACKGWTLVEVLVALGIVGALIAILVPAVLAVRGRSQFLECQNNVRQIGLAMHGHEATHGYFVKQEGADCTGGKLSGPLAEWLPWLERQALYDSIPPCGFGPSDQNGDVDVATFLCPADDTTSGTNVRLCYGSIGSFAYWPHDNPAETVRTYDGVFYSYGVVRAAEITDGLSQTIGASEKLQADPDGSFDRRRNVWNLGVSVRRDELIDLCSDPPKSPISFQKECGTIWWINYSYHLYYDHLVPPNWRGSDCSTPDGAVGLWRATSAHTGGVNTLRMDGSVDFVSDTVDLTVWRALGTRAGGEDLTTF